MGDAAKVTESAELKDRGTDSIREVDILVEQCVAGHKQTLAVECTSATELGQRRPADVGWVEEMLAKHRDLPTDYLVLVSETGFTKSANMKAAFYRAETIALGDALAQDWAKIVGRIPELHVDEISHAFKCSFAVTSSDGTLEYQPARLNQKAIEFSGGTSGTVHTLVDY